jgi:hypothetical protein
VVCLSNVQSGFFGRQEKDLTALAFGGKAAPPAPAPKAAAIAERLRRGCVGLYKGAGLRLRIVEEDGHLYGKFDDSPGRLFLLPVSDNELFMRTWYARIQVARDKRDRATGLTILWGGAGKPITLSRV